VRTIFRFESAIGADSEPPGRELMMLLFEAIRGVSSSATEPKGSDEGWLTNCQVDGQSLFVLFQELVEAEELTRRHLEAEQLAQSGRVREPSRGPRTWVGTVGRTFELWSRLLGRGDRPLSSLCDALDGVLQNNGGMRNPCWYTQREWVELNSRARRGPS
jgi:hypothetical protein